MNEYTETLKLYGLETNENLTTLSFEDEADWLELRTKGIGGSDVGAIMGLNKYMSPLGIYKQKILGIKNDVSGKSAVRKGKDLEPLIRSKYFAEMLGEKGFDVLELHHMLINNKYPWLRANLDGIAVPKDPALRKHTNNVVIEIKVVTEYAECNWFGDDYCGIPASYYAQVQEYMLVTETKMAILGALFEKDWEMHYFKIKADPVFQAELLKKSKLFFEYNMGLHIPPKMDSELDKEDIVAELSKPVDPASVRETQEITDAAIKYKDLSKQIKDLEAEKKLALTEITNRYLNGERSNSPLVKIKIGTTVRSSFDVAKFKEDHPEMVDNYMKTTESPNNYIR